MLQTAVVALLQQQVAPDVPYEIVVVDNNSSDDTQSVLQRLKARDRHNRLRTISEPRQGVSHGRNAGVAAARGEIIAFTDDDNYAAADWVATIDRIFQSNPGLHGTGGRVLPVWAKTAPEWLDRQHWSPLAVLDYGAQPFFTNVDNPRCLLTANLAIRKSVLEQIGGFSAAFARCQDHELLLRAWRAGYRVLYSPDLVVFAPVEPERLTPRYHAKWHRVHGEYASVMRLQELTDRHGRLLTEPVDTPRFFGTPGFVFRQLASEAKALVPALLQRRTSAWRSHWYRIGYYIAYIRGNIARTRQSRRGVTAELSTFVRESLQRRSRRVSVSLSRIAVVHALLMAFVLGSAYDIATGTEHWPLSPYPMFSTVEREYTLSGLRLMGVTDDGTGSEIPIRDYGMLKPLDQCRVSTAFARTVNNRNRAVFTTAMLDDRLNRYEELRLAGEHDGPRLKALRLYEMHWLLTPDGTNVDTPDRSEMIGEVTR